MKSFLVKINDDLTTNMVDIEDEKAQKAFFSSLRKRGINKLVITYTAPEDRISEKQEVLFKVLIDKVSKESGQDRDTVRETLLKNYSSKRNIKDLTKDEFQEFLESSNVFCSEFFNFSFKFDKNGFIEIVQL